MRQNEILPHKDSTVVNSKGQPQAMAVVAERRVAVGTIRRATAPGEAAPATATAHAEPPTFRSFWISLCATGIIFIPVAAPFPDIATHIVDAQLVGRLCSHKVSFFPRVITVPSHIINVIATTIFIATTIVATTTSKFPFCFSGEAEVLASQGI